MIFHKRSILIIYFPLNFNAKSFVTLYLHGKILGVSHYTSSHNCNQEILMHALVTSRISGVTSWEKYAVNFGATSATNATQAFSNARRHLTHITNIQTSSQELMNIMLSTLLKMGRQ